MRRFRFTYKPTCRCSIHRFAGLASLQQRLQKLGSGAVP